MKCVTEKSKVYYDGDTVNLIMMQKIEIRLTLSRLVTQMYASWVSSISISYILHRVWIIDYFERNLEPGEKFSRNKEIKYLHNFKYNLPSSVTDVYI